MLRPNRVTAFVVLSMLSLVPAARAQDQVTLRAAYQGAFLPEGTSLVVLRRPAQQTGTIQPAFLSKEEYPTTAEYYFRRDSLGPTGRSGRRYDTSKDSGQLYFLYALTPDSTLYWSYSAQKDSIKFDVIASGVMSVAPVEAAVVRRTLIRTFFGPRSDRVQVVMQDSLARSPQAADTLTAPDTTGSRNGREEDVARSDAADTSAAMPASAAMMPPRGLAPSGVHLSYGVLALLLMVMVALVAVPVVFLIRTRRDLVTARTQVINLRGGVREPGERPPLPDALTTALEQARAEKRKMEEEYEVLQARYAALKRKLDALQPGADLDH